MVDCAETESLAISAVFPAAKIFYCAFHVAQLWEKHLRKYGSVGGRIYSEYVAYLALEDNGLTSAPFLYFFFAFDGCQ